MIEVKIEVIPFGNEAERIQADRVFIWLEEGAGREHRRYGVSRIDPRKDTMELDNSYRRVEHHYRDGAVVLVRKALQALVP